MKILVSGNFKKQDSSPKQLTFIPPTILSLNFCQSQFQLASLAKLSLALITPTHPNTQPPHPQESSIVVTGWNIGVVQVLDGASQYLLNGFP